MYEIGEQSCDIFFLNDLEPPDYLFFKNQPRLLQSFKFADLMELKK